jgi:hypothetical protein
MTSINVPNDRTDPVAPAPSPASVNAPNPVQRDTSPPARSDAANPARSDALHPGKGGTKHAGARTAGVAGGSLRQAVQELVAGLESLCGDSRGDERAIAKRHVEAAKRFLAPPPHENRDVATPGDIQIQQDLQRAMR